MPASSIEPERLAETMRRAFSAVRSVEVPDISKRSVGYTVRIEPVSFTLMNFVIPFAVLAWTGFQSGNPDLVFGGLALGLVALYGMSGVMHVTWRANVRSWLRRGSLPPAR